MIVLCNTLWVWIIYNRKNETYKLALWGQLTLGVGSKGRHSDMTLPKNWARQKKCYCLWCKKAPLSNTHQMNLHKRVVGYCNISCSFAVKVMYFVVMILQHRMLRNIPAPNKMRGNAWFWVENWNNVIAFVYICCNY